MRRHNRCSKAVPLNFSNVSLWQLLNTGPLLFAGNPIRLFADVSGSTCDDEAHSKASHVSHGPILRFAKQSLLGFKVPMMRVQGTSQVIPRTNMQEVPFDKLPMPLAKKTLCKMLGTWIDELILEFN